MRRRMLNHCPASRSGRLGPGVPVRFVFYRRSGWSFFMILFAVAMSPVR